MRQDKKQTKGSIAPLYSRYGFFSEDDPEVLCDFEARLERNADWSTEEEPKKKSVINSLMLEVLNATKELYFLATNDPKAYIEIDEKFIENPSKFYKEISKKSTNPTPLLKAYIKLLRLQDPENLEDKHGDNVAGAVVYVAAAGFVAIGKSVKRKLSQPVRWKDNLEEYCMFIPSKKIEGGMWVEKVERSRKRSLQGELKRLQS